MTTRDEQFSLSVVIPTRSRPELVCEAVRSALTQTRPPVEVIVVVDGPDPQTVTALEALADPRIRLLSHNTSLGPGAARNTGIRAARGRFVALLDDDDRWLPNKLSVQLDVLSTSLDPDSTVLGSAARWDTGEQIEVWPTRAPRPGEPVGEYLFVRDHPGEGALATPTVVLPTALAGRCPFPTDGRAHEEWSWFLDLQDAGARFQVVLDPLVEVDARPRRRSVSNEQPWRASLAWARAHFRQLGPRAYSGFVLTEVARAAVLSRARPADQLRILSAAFAGRPRPRDLARALVRPLVLRRRALGADR